tara:strand:+ start:308 stop:1042 length:735 start_codon:yes stop_codon:yes gene_type:complete
MINKPPKRPPAVSVGKYDSFSSDTNNGSINDKSISNDHSKKIDSKADNKLSVIKYGSIELHHIKDDEYKLLANDHKFSLADIAKMLNKKWEEINKARIKLKLKSLALTQEESSLIIDYLADPVKYETIFRKENENSQSSMSSSDWILLGLGCGVLVGGAIWLLTKNSSASRAAYGSANFAINGAQAATSTIPTTAYAAAQTAVTTSNLPNIIGIASTLDGITPIFRGPRGGIFKYTRNFNKSYL